MVAKLALLAITISLVISSCGLDQDMIEEGQVPFDVQVYTDSRSEKDAYFAGEESPLPDNEREHFKGLRYFKPVEEFVVNAQFSASTDTDTMTIQTTKNDLRKAMIYGTLTFTIGGKECQLTAFRFVGSTHAAMFVPFKDATTGSQTYQTGRYLDIELVDGAGAYVIDFNEAYNPFCAYNDRYSCPLVPDENTLDVKITAGERTWNH